MIFIQRNEFYLESEDGRYTVDKAVGGRDFRYTAWRRFSADTCMPINLGCFDTARLAKQQCEIDASHVISEAHP